MAALTLRAITGREQVQQSQAQLTPVTPVTPVTPAKPPAGVPEGALPADILLPRAEEPPPPPPAPKPSFQEMLDDPRSAEEIRAAMEGGRNWRAGVTEEWGPIPRGAIAMAGKDSSIEVRQTPEGMEARIPPAPGTRDAPVPIETPADVHLGAEQTAQPTPAQAEAGNYQKRHVEWQGLDVAIETEKGAARTGIGGDGKPWSVTMPAPYGYIKRTKGKDGEEIDLTLGPNPQAPNVFVIDQIDPRTGKFDEHKSFAGYDNDTLAVTDYFSSFSDGSGPLRMGAVTPMSVPEYKTWVKSGNLKKPLAYEPPLPVKHVTPPKAKGPLSLIQYLASRGGLKPDPGGELKSLGITGKTRIVIPGLGYRNVMRHGGADLDQALEWALEAGYLTDPGWNKPNVARTTTPNDLLRLLADEGAGKRTFTQGEELTDEDAKAKRAKEQAEEQRAGVEQEVRDFVKEHGLLASDEQIRKAAETALVSNADPHQALFDILEQEAFDEPDHGVTLPVEEPADARPPQRTGTDETGGGVAAPVEPTRPEPKPAAEQAPPVIKPDEAQHGGGEAATDTGTGGYQPRVANLSRLAQVELNSFINNPKVRMALRGAVKIDRTYDIPAFAGYSKDGKTVYIDRSYEGPDLPKVVRHERVEKAGIDVFGWKYSRAHDMALTDEHMGLDDPLAYERDLKPHIDKAMAKTPERVPADLDQTPYEGKPELLAAIAKAQKKPVTPQIPPPGGGTKYVLPSFATGHKPKPAPKTAEPGAEGKPQLVRDDKGKPLTVYHGTPNTFEQFDPARVGDQVGSAMGFSFTTDRDYASIYSGDKGRIVSANLLMANPKRMEVEEFSHTLRLTKERARAKQSELKKEGYDGIIVKDFDELGHTSDLYVVFDQQQIKQLKEPATEKGADNKPQLVIPGAEKLTPAEQGQRGADQKPSLPSLTSPASISTTKEAGLPERMDRASLESLLPKIESMSAAEKTRTAEWIKQQYAEQARLGEQIATTCLEQGGTFSIR